MKRVLIIAYYWPPAGGPGVQRWLKFVTYFREFDIEPVVYVPDNPHYPLIDKSFLGEVPDDITVLKQPIKEPYRWAKLLSGKKTKQLSSGIIPKKKASPIARAMLWVRGNFFIPDARVGWVKPSVRFLTKYLSENPVDLVITTGPPHSLHLIGRALKRDLGLTWMTDFRDPWTTIHYHASLRLSQSSKKKHKELERSVLTECDQVVVTSKTTAEEFARITDVPVEVITNGYDIKEDIKAVLDERFSLVHVGSLLSERNPIVLWEVLTELCLENPEFDDSLEIKLAGTVSQDIVDAIESVGLGEKLMLPGYVPHSEAVQMQHNARILLLIEMNTPETRVILPGKLFEYLAARRPVLAFGPEGSDIADILIETKSGDYFSYDQKEELKQRVRQLYEAFRQGGPFLTSENVEKYSRRNITARMAKIITAIS